MSLLARLAHSPDARFATAKSVASRTLAANVACRQFGIASSAGQSIDSSSSIQWIADLHAWSAPNMLFTAVKNADSSLSAALKKNLSRGDLFSISAFVALA